MVILLLFLFLAKGSSQLVKNKSWQKVFTFISNRLAELDRNDYKIIAFTTTNNFTSEINFRPEGDTVFIEAFANIGKGSIYEGKIQLSKREFSLKSMKKSSDTLIASNSFEYSKQQSELNFSKLSFKYTRNRDFNVTSEFSAKLSVLLIGVPDEGIISKGTTSYDNSVYGLIVYVKYSK